ncbi:MAG: efflux RND transporter periplasmic adaptor subunit [Planctomycetes bacterium]|nr:efflux RND transporter periplasmic adaptor subunit [Planctomycetota bacterium]
MSGCGSNPAPTTATPVATRSVEVIEVQPGSEREATQLIGRVEPGQEVTLYFEVPGVVADVFVEEGSDVKPGDPIARLVLDDYELAFSRAKAEFSAAKAEWELMRAGTRKEDIDLARADHERAKARNAYWAAEYDRVKKLAESRAISDSEFQQVGRERDAAVQEELMAKAGLDRAIAGFRKEEIANAAAKLEASRQAAILAERQLQKATLKAPFKGRVERRLADPGAYVNVFPMGGVPIVHVVNLESVDAVISVPELMLDRFAAGNEIEIVSAVNAKLRGAGRVIHVGQVADRASGTYAVRVRLPNPDGRFSGGMIVVANSRAPASRDSIRVPVTAIRRAYGQSPYVLLVAPDSKIVERPVELGPITANDVEIINGLTGGELLVVRGQHLVVAGDRVQYQSFNKVPIAQKPGTPP